MESGFTVFNDVALFMIDGGFFMWPILGAWLIGIGISINKFIMLRSYDTDGPSFMNEIHKYIIGNDSKSAIKICSDTKGVLPKVLKNGLKRANQSLEQVQNAIDATALEVIPLVDKWLNYLGLLANISTLMGLLGTIYGLIDSFEAVGAADPSQKAAILSAGISKAMNTTAIGLLSAISIMVIHQILANKAEKIISQIDEFSVKLLDLLGTKKVVYDSGLTTESPSEEILTEGSEA